MNFVFWFSVFIAIWVILGFFLWWLLSKQKLPENKCTEQGYHTYNDLQNKLVCNECGFINPIRPKEVKKEK